MLPRPIGILDEHPEWSSRLMAELAHRRLPFEKIVYFYDVNATSNLVANAPDVVGFDPHFADYITRRVAPP